MGIFKSKNPDFWMTGVLLDDNHSKIMDRTIDVKIMLSNGAEMPSGAYANPAGYDLGIFCSQPIMLEPLERHVFGTGLSLEIPEGYCAFICPKSGVTSKSGLTILNSPGVIDADYRGEIKIIVVNNGLKQVVIPNKSKIAQILFMPVMTPKFIVVKKLGTTKRNHKGLGSSLTYEENSGERLQTN